jgi:hypothetical protein
VSEYAAQNGLRMQLHLSETEKEHLECIERHGMTPTAYFASLGVLDVPTTAAHCVYVTDDDIAIMKEKVEQYNQLQEAMRAVDPENEYEVRRLKNLLTQKYLELLYTNPAGFTLTARMTTNYRCLKNIWRQRRNHRLPEWREFCKWIETLPYAKELIING